MKRHSRGSAFDISIRGDELEHNRIQLEHNLQNTELSFHLSSTSDDENNDGHHNRRRPHHRHDSSVEYPRHLSEPSMPEFPSFAHRSRDHFGDEDTSHVHAWSYRTGDDDEGINPYGGETVSTAAHHASALTISAGLGGGRAARRDPSLSGAEYDPDRPLHAMIAGVNSKHSMFDTDPQKNTAVGMTYDPLVVDSTAELDKILESGHAPPPNFQSRSIRPLSPMSSASSSASDSENRQQTHASSRPKLSDHLRHVSFSPKRPRSVQGNNSNPSSPLTHARRVPEEYDASMNAPTPRPTRRANIFPSYASSPAQPEVRLQPATPSTGGSRFTRMVRGINKELEATQQQMNASKQTVPMRPSSAPVERNPFHDVTKQPEPAASTRNPTPRRTSMRDTTKSRIHLPDVTGLTAAVESPARPGVQYYPYKADDRPRDSEARLLQTLSAVQRQLRDLEDENSISRRRVRELEMELEECKREVARERTRLFEREELSVRQQHPDWSYRSAGKGKGKARAREGPPEIDDARLHARYKEAVDEKKALEALINSLRSHLTRLTSELASHQELLTELRKLRESDAQALREKGTEIIQLKEEVQRLAGEVEVLRGVVEEGLKERRASREIQVENSAADVAMSQDLEEEETEEEELGHDEEEGVHDSEEEEPEPFDPISIQESSQVNNRADRTMRTDFATLGSTNLGGSTNAAGSRFVNDEELDQIAAELEERRSNRSNSSIPAQNQFPQSPSPPRSPSPVRRNARVTEVVDEGERPQTPIDSQQSRPYSRGSQPEPSTSRPSAPTPGHATRQYGHAREHHNVEPETPFPRIRGEQLERLFFSAPEHNAKTCTVCYRRRHRNSAPSPSWSNPRNAHHARQTEGQPEEAQESDEGYEGSEGADAERPTAAAAASKGKQPEPVAFSDGPARWRQTAQKQGLPPQTVVARVIRELEDDFTHYKSIYVELADQYKIMDAASDVPRRNTLAKHLREVVDILEQKGDQIASLYDLLQFKDKPVSESIVPEKGNGISGATSPWGRQASKRRGIS
ncbi:hypothetical protein BDZ97DRAFT_1754952 [Flammula alnicola]|nr:hypothetical protein BDZ97DRAFT_1754952 [Flammula alnicola]